MAFPFAETLEDLNEVRGLLTDDPNTLTPFDRARQSIGRGICRAASSNPAQFFTSTTGTGLGIEAVCRPYWNQEGDTGPTDSTPLPGGQCPGVPYDIDVFVPDARDGTCASGILLRKGNLTGPLSQLRVEFGTNTRECGGETYTSGTVLVNDGAGNPQFLTVITGTGGAFYPSGGIGSAQITIDRADGQPDTCGSEPVSPNPGTGPVQSLPASGGGTPEELPWTIGVPVKVDERGRPVLSPTVPPFNIEIPITIEDIPITFNLGGPSGGQPRPQPFQPQSPGDVGAPGPDATTGEGGEAEGEEPDKYLVGVKVDVLQVPPGGNIRFRSGMPYYVGACVVELGTENGLDQQPEAQFLHSGQFFYAPEGSNKWRVSAYVGYDFRVTPYYRESG